MKAVLLLCNFDKKGKETTVEFAKFGRDSNGKWILYRGSAYPDKSEASYFPTQARAENAIEQTRKSQTYKFYDWGKKCSYHIINVKRSK